MTIHTIFDSSISSRERRASSSYPFVLVVYAMAVLTHTQTKPSTSLKGNKTKRPWVKTPLIESAALSEAAGWYAQFP